MKGYPAMRTDTPPGTTRQPARETSVALPAPRRSSSIRLLVKVVLAVMTIGFGAYCAVRSSGITNPLAASGFVRQREEFSGAVEQTISAGSYTYYALRLSDGQLRWTVVMSREHRGAKWLYVTSFGSRTDFVSPRLQRNFERLYFVSVRKHNG